MERLGTRWLTTTVRVLVLLFLAASPTAQTAAAASPVSVPADEVHHYREVTGTEIKAVEWRLTKGDRYTLTYASTGETHVTVTDRDYDTRRWQVVARDGKTDLTATRDDEAIVVYGRFGGKPINKRLDIDHCPWYQATSLSLRGFVASDEAERLFWTIRSDTLTVYKIKAVRKGVERPEVGHRLLHIRLTLPGLLAPFWKSDYWFDFPEGVFFRFQGPSGPPGSPMTTVTRMPG